MSRKPLALSFGASLLVQALNVLTGILLARWLGPAGRGQLAAVLLWPAMLATVGNLGASDAVTYHAARRTTGIGVLAGTAVALAAALSAGLVAVGLAVVPHVLHAYGSSTVHACLVFLAFIPLNLVALALMSVLAGHQRFRSFNGLRLLVVVISAAAIGFLALRGRLTVPGAAWAYLVANLATLLAAAAVFARIGVRRLGFSAGLARRILGYGVRSHVGVVSSTLNERLDQLVISAVLAPGRLGLYVVAVTLTSITALVGSSVSLVALPVIAREADSARQAALAQRLVSTTVLLSGLLTVPVLVAMPEAIRICFGSAFAGAAGPARILLVASVVLSTSRTLSAVLKAVGRPLTAGSGEGLALVVTMTSLAALLPAFGLTGAAIASLLAYSVSAAWMVQRASRMLCLRPATLLLPRLRAPVPIGGPA